MPGDVNCIFTKVLIPFVEKEVGPEGVAAVLRTAGRSRDYLVADHNWLPLPLANELVRVTGFPCSTTPFGKGIVDETIPNFHGVYAGIAGKHVYMPWARSCDLVLRLGPLNSDVNTFGFTTIPDPQVTIA